MVDTEARVEADGRCLHLRCRWCAVAMSLLLDPDIPDAADPRPALAVLRDEARARESCALRVGSARLSLEVRAREFDGCRWRVACQLLDDSAPLCGWSPPNRIEEYFLRAMGTVHASATRFRHEDGVARYYELSFEVTTPAPTTLPLLEPPPPRSPSQSPHRDCPLLSLLRPVPLAAALPLPARAPCEEAPPTGSPPLPQSPAKPRERLEWQQKLQEQQEQQLQLWHERRQLQKQPPQSQPPSPQLPPKQQQPSTQPQQSSQKPPQPPQQPRQQTQQPQQQHSRQFHPLVVCSEEPTSFTQLKEIELSRVEQELERSAASATDGGGVPVGDSFELGTMCSGPMRRLRREWVATPGFAQHTSVYVTVSCTGFNAACTASIEICDSLNRDEVLFRAQPVSLSEIGVELLRIKFRVGRSCRKYHCGNFVARVVIQEEQAGVIRKTDFCKPFLVVSNVAQLGGTSSLLLLVVRCGVVGNISDFHSEAPGSIPGIGKFLSFCLLFRFGGAVCFFLCLFFLGGLTRLCRGCSKAGLQQFQP
eukprot:TRINITY_DN958_c0_g1_i2.p1 TRINITY_DN958_c0_g1~~TRINITY_DN958_c0_g1_i2.p1  ORF type:complete len:554 (+),score=144.97 TRINITY_DN958_c0_g1_i2:60-1664(+)